MKYWATSSVTLLILIAVLLPGSNIPDVGIGGIDKLAHITLFFLWSVALRFDFSKNFKWLIGLLVGLGFSYLTELLQLFVEDRTYDMYDMVADFIGMLLGLSCGKFVLELIQQFWPFKKQH